MNAHVYVIWTAFVEDECAYSEQSQLIYSQKEKFCAETQMFRSLIPNS